MYHGDYQDALFGSLKQWESSERETGSGGAEDTALQGFHPKPVRLTVFCLTVEGQRYLFMTSHTLVAILRGHFTQIKNNLFSVLTQAVSMQKGFFVQGFERKDKKYVCILRLVEVKRIFYGCC